MLWQASYPLPPYRMTDARQAGLVDLTLAGSPARSFLGNFASRLVLIGGLVSITLLIDTVARRPEPSNTRRLTDRSLLRLRRPSVTMSSGSAPKRLPPAERITQ